MKNTFFVSASILVLTACGQQHPAPLNAYGVDKGAGSVGVHTVLNGDTVYEIAQNYQLPMREIITLNNIEAPYVLNTGFRMKLPPPNEHQVREGDTVYSIARMYETSINRLVKLNDLTPPSYTVRTGQKLRLPTPTLKAQEAIARQARYNESVANVKPRQQSNIATPQNKPRAQQASVQRAQVRNKLPKRTPKMSGNGRFMQPVNGEVISSYGPKAGGLHNDGINIKAVRGTAVRSAENGVVVYTGDDLEGYGNLRRTCTIAGCEMKWSSSPSHKAES